MAFRRRRTGPLYRHGKNHLAHSRRLLGQVQRTGLINEFDQVQLLGNPHQCPYVADTTLANGAHACQVRDRRWIRRAQNCLPREGPLASGIPHRLRRNSVMPPAH